MRFGQGRESSNVEDRRGGRMVLADTEDTWRALFEQSGKVYQDPKQELQADWLAGVWAYHADKARQVLESGDVEEALTAAASAIGDDRLQKQVQGYAVPDSFTHGSSEQRVRWFRRGLDGGKVSGCDTFSTASR